MNHQAEEVIVETNFKQLITTLRFSTIVSKVMLMNNPMKRTKKLWLEIFFFLLLDLSYLNFLIGQNF